MVYSILTLAHWYTRISVGECSWMKATTPNLCKLSRKLFASFFLSQPYVVFISHIFRIYIFFPYGFGSAIVSYSKTKYRLVWRKQTPNLLHIHLSLYFPHFLINRMPLWLVSTVTAYYYYLPPFFHSFYTLFDYSSLFSSFFFC